MMRSTALALLLTIGATPALAQSVRADVVALEEWTAESLYEEARSAEEFIDEMEVRGAAGTEIGHVEDIIVGRDGTLLAVVAEVGGFLEIGDTHVSVPWSEIEIGDGYIETQLVEDNVGDYGLFDHDYFTREDVTAAPTDDLENASSGPRVFRLSELIGDYARLVDSAEPVAYGYVSDALLKEGKIAAVVVDPDTDGVDPGFYAYPFTGVATGPNTLAYDLPYAKEEIESDAAKFDYDRLENS